MKTLFAAIGMIAMMTSASAKELVELTTRFTASTVIGQNIIQMVNVLNKVQDKYEFKYANISGAGGESAYSAGFEKAKSGTKIVFVSSISDFTFGKVEFPHRTWSENDLIFVSGLFRSPPAIFVAKDSPINTVDELVASIRKKPMGYISSNVNSRSNIYIGEQFIAHYKLDNVKALKYGPVPDIIASVVRGEADFTIFSVTDVPALKPIAIVSENRIESMPDLVTIKELGVKDATINTMSFISVPMQFPELARDVMDAMEKVCKDKEFLDIVRARKYDISNMCMKGGDIRAITESEYKRISKSM
jgi:putative tricarboxylic transport membrane protein